MKKTKANAHIDRNAKAAAGAENRRAVRLVKAQKSVEKNITQMKKIGANNKIVAALTGKSNQAAHQAANAKSAAIAADLRNQRIAEHDQRNAERKKAA